jgi:hypothetical protein
VLYSRSVNKATRIGTCLLGIVAAVVVGCADGRQRPPCRPPAAAGEIGSICGFHGPEDLEYVRRTGVIVVSNLRLDGRLGEGGGFLSGFEPGEAPAVVRLWPTASGAPAQPAPELGDPACIEPPPAESFSPHGITSTALEDGRVLLYVAAHASAGRSREAIEIFEMRGRGHDTTLVWNACIPTAGAIQANDVVLTPDGTVIVSNYQPDGSMRHMLLAALFGMRSGNVMAWSSATGWRVVPSTEAELANGVAVARRGENVLFAETMTGVIHRVPLAGGGGGIDVEIGGNPDNFTQTPRGTLLVATHTAGAAFLACRLGRRPCKTTWSVYEIDPDTLATRKVIDHDGSVVGAVATALEVEGLLYFGSVFDDRIGVMRIGPP